MPNAKIKSQSFINTLSSLLTLSLSHLKLSSLSLLVVKYNGSGSWVFNGVFGGGFVGQRPGGGFSGFGLIFAELV